MSIATVVTFGYGSFGSVNAIPPLGYGDFAGGDTLIDNDTTPGAATLNAITAASAATLIDNDTTASTATLTDVTAATAATLIDNDTTPGAATLTDAT